MFISHNCRAVTQTTISCVAATFTNYGDTTMRTVVCTIGPGDLSFVVGQSISVHLQLIALPKEYKRAVHFINSMAMLLHL